MSIFSWEPRSLVWHFPQVTQCLIKKTRKYIHAIWCDGPMVETEQAAESRAGRCLITCELSPEGWLAMGEGVAARTERVKTVAV